MGITKGEFKDETIGWKAFRYTEGKELGYSSHEIHWSDYGECVAEMVHGEDDAKLIAAAPELLEAVQKLIEVYNEKGHLFDYNIDIAKKAINKALN